MLKVRRAVSAARLASHFAFNAIYPFLIRHGTKKTTCEWQNQSCQTNMSLEHYLKGYKQREMNFENFLG